MSVKHTQYQSIIVYIGDYLHERVFGQRVVDISIRFWQIFKLNIPEDYVSVIIMFIVLLLIKSRVFNKSAIGRVALIEQNICSDSEILGQWRFQWVRKFTFSSQRPLLDCSVC